MMCPICRGATVFKGGCKGEVVIDIEVVCNKCDIIWRFIGIKKGDEE